jgi:dihydrofolate reductase
LAKSLDQIVEDFRTRPSTRAPFFNNTAKYVVSETLDEATWNNSTIIGAYDPDAIRSLKDEVGDIYVSGSGTLVRAMLGDGLVDELHLLLYPLTRGAGPRLFTEEAAPTTMSLASAEADGHPHARSPAISTIRPVNRSPPSAGTLVWSASRSRCQSNSRLARSSAREPTPR